MAVIRKAVAADAAALSALAERTFRVTFGPSNSAENMDLHCKAHYSAALQAAEIADAGTVTLVAEHERQLAGYAQVRWGRAPEFVHATAPGELQRLYVDAAWHGQGLARLLMDAALAELQQRGCDRVWLGVWEQNPRAIAFYKKLGFVEAGAHVFAVGNDPQRDLVMVKIIE